MLMINFMQTAQQIGSNVRPIKIKMTRPEIIWDSFENEQKTLINEIEFSNNAMVAFEKDKESQQ